LKTKNKWKYESIEDSQYIKDKKEIIKKNGNGWWLFIDRVLSDKIKKSKEKK
tara:strand:- start:23709 stop:23864 length:156 start_codon:yes stop_codon:yes gene_type:complete